MKGNLMRKTRSLLLSITSLILLAALAACAPAATPDPSPLLTAAVQTYQAQLSQTADAAPDTPTPAPSNTPEPPAEASPTPPDLPTAVPQVDDKAEFVSQSPEDGSEVGLKRKFDAVWVLRNTGKTTWDKRYALRYFSGAALGERAAYFLPKDVPPGEEARIVVDMIAPGYAGDFTTIWVLSNADGVNFFDVYLNVKVVEKTRTPTRRPTNTPGTPTP
ncbi:hypothetical protein ADN01_00585 [Levilinea saccharolytica]|uniref:Nbr1 FW domain-containing protein n=3 Tax=Levilinea saccharolytica TaxID=229921 RepID=A0A0P6Y2B2_9CHLR|nr:hypothetical protein ADN01_00585 [Levilinea saccharolytica]